MYKDLCLKLEDTSGKLLGLSIREDRITKFSLSRNILLFPRGNNQNELLSVYLEYAELRENPSPDVYACAQFVIALSPPSDPTRFVSQGKGIHLYIQSRVYHHFMLKQQHSLPSSILRRGN